jgi:iron(III) transport system ATP-binding protein
MTSNAPSSLELRNIDVSINQCEVLRRIAFDILPGELFVILGGSGAGKSTLLRAIAGLDAVASGEIWLDDEDITRRPANRRRIALMLQDYPLWPHMTVAANLAFGMKQHRLRRAERRARVQRGLELVGLSDFHRHLPWQLSPGQRQRAVLARTLLAGARVDLLDEPFSAQDTQRRERLLRVLRRLQQQTGKTTVLATEDRFEALRVADRIAVIHEGELQQVGTPVELYDTPRNRHVAAYLGSANLIDGEIEYAGDQAMFHAHNGVVIPLFDHAVRRARTGCAMFRPHDLRIVSHTEEPFGDLIRFSGRVEQTEFLGDSVRYSIDLAGWVVWMDLPRATGQPALHIGDKLVIGLDPARIRILEN